MGGAPQQEMCDVLGGITAGRARSVRRKTDAVLVRSKKERVAVAAKASKLAPFGARKRGLLTRGGRDRRRTKLAANERSPRRENARSENTIDARKGNGHSLGRKSESSFCQEVSPIVTGDVGMTGDPAKGDRDRVRGERGERRPNREESSREREGGASLKLAQRGERVREKRERGEVARKAVVISPEQSVLQSS